MIKYVIHDRRNNVFPVVNKADILTAQETRVSRAVIDEDVVATFESIEPEEMQKFFHVIVKSDIDDQERRCRLTGGTFG
jgi:septin family protein